MDVFEQGKRWTMLIISQTIDVHEPITPENRSWYRPNKRGIKSVIKLLTLVYIHHLGNEDGGR